MTGIGYRLHENIDIGTGQVIYRGNAHERISKGKVYVSIEGRMGEPINQRVKFYGKVLTPL